MPSVIEEFRLENLSRDQKLQLIDELWESVALDETQPVLTPAQLADLDARIEYRKQNPHPGYTWDEVKARMMSERSASGHC